MAELLTAMDGAPNIRECIRRLLNAALDIHFNEDKPGGCLVALSVLESEQLDVQSRVQMQQTIHELKSALQTRLMRAKKAGELPQDSDSAATATTIATAMTGMTVVGKANVSRAALKKTVDQVVCLLRWPDAARQTG